MDLLFIVLVISHTQTQTHTHLHTVDYIPLPVEENMSLYIYICVHVFPHAYRYIHKRIHKCICQYLSNSFLSSFPRGNSVCSGWSQGQPHVCFLTNDLYTTTSFHSSLYFLKNVARYKCEGRLSQTLKLAFQRLENNIYQKFRCFS